MEFAKKTIVVFESGWPEAEANSMASIFSSDIAGSLMVREGSANFLNLLRRIPEVLLVTPCLQGKSAVESARILKRRSPEAQIIVLYQIDEEKPNRADFREAEIPQPEEIPEAITLTPPGRSVYKELTAREKQVMHFLATGSRYQEVADQLSISFETVKSHIKNICRKLAARNRTEAIAIYYNFISSPDFGPGAGGLMNARNAARIPAGV